ncbi:DUF6355 family natural product biosynthesis protein [Streptomyces sp. NPDC006879]|uniref:DUF6355 family natural product biosynthesis protein n=1 Tax=Streptomyces sp. NPDC006879 TaxID=3364767 RepID=UPI003686E16E
MRKSRVLTSALSVTALVFGLSVSATAAAPASALNPCGFFETASDAYYNHCTSDGSHIVIEIDDWGPNTLRCVGPGTTWIGAAGDVDGAWYVGRTC